MHVDGPFKFTIQESRLDIDLVNFEVVGGSKCKEEMDGIGLRDGQKFW